MEIDEGIWMNDMKKYNKYLLITCVLPLIVTLNGCDSYFKFVRHEAPLPPQGDLLLSHRSPAVKYPAFAGRGIGSMAGLPFVVPWFFVGFIPTLIDQSVHETYHIEYSEKGDQSMEVILAPCILSAIAGKYALGLPTWLIFGWWWPEQNTAPPGSLEKNTVHNGAGGS